MDEDCIRCGRLAMEGSELCEKCATDDARYGQWKNEINLSHQLHKDEGEE